MKKLVSTLIAMMILLTNVNLAVFAEPEPQPVEGTAEDGVYTWSFGSQEVSGKGIYDYSDEYAGIRLAMGENDSITGTKGIYFSSPSCNEPPLSAKDSNRYLLLKPVYSGTVKLKIGFLQASGSSKCRIWYNDFGESISFDDVNTGLLTKGYSEKGAQLGTDITSTAVQELSFEVTAGHVYSLHTYNKGSYISQLYYESSFIVGKTTTPVIQLPVSAGDTVLSGTCEKDAAVQVKINNQEEKTAVTNGEKWSLSGITLAENDEISVVATAEGKNPSNAATTKVLAPGDICRVTLESGPNGKIETNQADNHKVAKGTKVIVTAVPEEGYEVSELKINGTPVEVTGNRYEFVVEQNVTVSAVFQKIIYYDIHLPVNAEHGSVTIAGGDKAGTAARGDKITLSVKADAGYRIKDLTYTFDGKTVHIKYSRSFEMPAADVTIGATFTEVAVISEIDSSFNSADRITMKVDGKPFFYNGIQIRVDKVGSYGYGDTELQNMFTTAKNDGFTVANSQIHWKQIQPDTVVNASETAYVKGGTNSGTNYPANGIVYTEYTQNADEQSLAYLKFDLPSIEEGGQYAAAKIRIYVSEINGTAPLRVYGIENTAWSADSITWNNAPNHNGYEIIDSAFDTTAPTWDPVNKEEYYDFDVTDFINRCKNKDQVSFMIRTDESAAVKVGIDTESKAPVLTLSRDDVYDFSYLDKVIGFAENAGIKLEILWFATDTCQQSHETRVPYYVLNNYQKSLKSDGTPAKNKSNGYLFLMCKNDPALRAKEKEAIQAMFDHIAEYNKANGEKNTVIGCQVSNEPAVGRLASGTDRYFDRCHCDICNQKFEQSSNLKDFQNRTMWEYNDNLASGIKESDYSVWTRVNNYSGTDASSLVYNETMRTANQGTNLDFIGLDPYQKDTSYLYHYGHTTVQHLNGSGEFLNYSMGKNLPMVMENGGDYSNTPQLVMASVAGGAFYNVYDLCSTDGHGLYVDDNKTLKPNGDYVAVLRETNKMLNKIAGHLATKKSDAAGGGRLLFFNPLSDNTASSQKAVRSVPVMYDTSNNGVGIAVEASGKEIVLESTTASKFTLDEISQYNIASVETGYYDADVWVKTGDKTYTQTDNGMIIDIAAYECIRVLTSEEISAAKVITPVTGAAENGIYTWSFGAEEVSGQGTYNYRDEYASIQTAIGAADSITKEDGIYFSAAGCGESDSAGDNHRYLLVKPEYTGTLTLKIKFINATSSGNGRLWYNDFGTDTTFDEIDASTLKKGTGTQIGGNITDSEIQTISFEVEAGHLYSLHTYNRSSYLSEMSYISEDITVTEPPAFDYPMEFSQVTVGEDNRLAVNVTCHDTELSAAKLFVAEYDSDNTMSRVAMYDVNGTGAVDLKGYTVSPGRKTKLFLWNNTSEMKPMAEFYEIK